MLELYYGAMRKLKMIALALFLYQGQVVMEKPTVVEFLWDFMFDAIHHRGQLSAYLRPMGGKVPSIYGPSADDTGM